jgi:hypothetical protein
VQDLPQPFPPDPDSGTLALNAWITSRTVSSSAATSRAIAGTRVPDADAMMIIARRTRTDSCLPRRTICCSRCPLLIRQPPRPHRLSHLASRYSIHLTIERGSLITACQPTGERSWSAH